MVSSSPPPERVIACVLLAAFKLIGLCLWSGPERPVIHTCQPTGPTYSHANHMEVGWAKIRKDSCKPLIHILCLLQQTLHLVSPPSTDTTKKIVHAKNATHFPVSQRKHKNAAEKAPHFPVSQRVRHLLKTTAVSTLFC